MVAYDERMDLVVSRFVDATAMLTLNRPSRANAYDGELLDALERALAWACGNDAIRVVALFGRGSHFCSGADRESLEGRTFRDALALQSARLFDSVARFPKPVVAALHGAVLGGGLELALACDVRVAARDAVFGFPEVGLGLIPAAGGTSRLTSLVGAGAARLLILTARRIDAAEALRLGLVGEVCEPDRLDDLALGLAREIASHDPVAVQLARAALDVGTGDFASVAQAVLYHRRQASSVPATALPPFSRADIDCASGGTFA